MKVYGLIILLCVSLLFVSKYDDAQAVPSNSQNNFNDLKFGGTVNQTSTSNSTLSNHAESLTQTLSIQTSLSVTKTLGTPTTTNQTSTTQTPSNETSTKIPSNETLSKQDTQLLEKQFLTEGNALFDQGNYTDAITYYDKALLLNSTDINALYNKGLSFDNLGRLDEAITYYDKVLTINPEDTDALFNKGLALEELGKKDNATLYYKKVLDINPNDAGALNKLNLTFNNANKTETVGVQNVDQTLQIVVGVFIAILIGIIVIDRVAKRRGGKSDTTVMTKSDLEEPDQTLDKKSKEIDDDEWKGV